MNDKLKKIVLKRNITTKESRDFWKFVDEVAEEVKTWECWKRGCRKFPECEHNKKGE